MRSLSIRQKIILLFSAITILLVIVLARLSYVSVKEIYLEQAADHVTMLSSLVAADLDSAYLPFLSPGQEQAQNYYRDYLKQMVRKTGLNNAFIFNNNLDVLVSSDPDIFESELQLNKTEIDNLGINQSAASFPFADVQKNWYIWGFYRIDDDFYLGIRESINRLERVNQLSKLFLLIGATGVILTILGGWFIARMIARPVDKLVGFSKKIGSGDFDAPPPEISHGEFAILKNTMQQMQNDLAAKNEEREQMLAQIAHEIRNPLGGIELLAGLIKEDSEKNSPVNLHSTKILHEVSALKEQIASFLYYSKPLESKPQEVLLDDVVKDVRMIYNQRLQEKKVRFEYKDCAYKLYFDPGHLKQVLSNLAANSLDAVAENGKIEIKVSQNGTRGFEIRDDGPGLDEKYIKNIFKPFFTTKSNGSGLGLAISQKLCRQNNAILEYDNNFKSGSRFVMTIIE